MRVEAVKNVNGYDENFGLEANFFEGGEESDLILKFLDNGAKILYTSEIRVWHRQDKSILNTSKKHLGYEEAWGALFRKWSFSGRYRGVTFLTFLFLLSKSFMGSLYWVFRGNFNNSWFYLMKNRARLRGWFKYGRSLC
jgi:GT2 family glycosyltransferase